jgi:hypothetical protein
VVVCPGIHPQNRLCPVAKKRIELIKLPLLRSLYWIVSSNSLKSSHTWWLTPVILATEEAEVRRIAVQGRPRQKFSKTSPQSISQVWWHVPGYLGSIKRRISVQAGWAEA